MRDVISYRGPDDAGYYLSGEVGLGSRRLSIIDLSARGHMPMISQDERYIIVYNGEIYNHRSLRSDLESRGHTFCSHTDTEVILALYSEMGTAMLPLLNGMFAIAIWDEKEHSLFLARDRSGIKPLFYASWEGSLYFSSEIKSILAAGLPLEFDHSIWAELLCFRYLAGETTPYRGIQELLPGHYLIYKNETMQLRRWWHLGEMVDQAREQLPGNSIEWFRSAFDESVDLQRISDVPVGVFLSGGIDSSSLAASLASQVGHSLNSFTVRFEDARYDEGVLAKEVADQWKLDFHDLFIPTDKIVPLLREAIWLNDEPLAHGNELHILALSRLAKRLVTVLLSGEGADELLGGYVRYRPLLFAPWLQQSAAVIRWLDRGFGWQGRWHKLARFLRMGSIDDFVLFNSCDVLPHELEALGFYASYDLEYRRNMLAEGKQIYPEEPVRQLMYLDQHTFLVSELDRIDRMSMGASIEARVPFLDHRLMQVSAALPTRAHFQYGLGKRMLRQAAARRLPRSVLTHHKWGFGVPWNRYFREVPELRDMILQMHTCSPIVDGPLEPEKVRRLAEEYLRGDDAQSALIGGLAMITLWWQEVRAHSVLQAVGSA